MAANLTIQDMLARLLAMEKYYVQGNGSLGERYLEQDRGEFSYEIKPALYKIVSEDNLSADVMKCHRIFQSLQPILEIEENPPQKSAQKAQIAQNSSSPKSSIFSVAWGALSYFGAKIFSSTPSEASQPAKVALPHEPDFVKFPAAAPAGQTVRAQKPFEEPAVLFGTLNQFKVKNGKSACGVISTLGVLYLVNGRINKPQDLDDITIEGSRIYSDIILTQIYNMGFTAEDANNVEFFLTLYAPFTKNLVAIGKYNERPGRNRMNLDQIQPGQEVKEFIEMGRWLQQLSLERHGKKIGAIFTKTPETYALTVQALPADGVKIEYVNSHGERDNHGDVAIVKRTFNSIEDFAIFLARNITAIPDAPMYNEFGCIAVDLRK